MLRQENAAEPFFEEEVTEAVLPSLEWRAEGRVRRPVLARGGIVADEVSSIIVLLIFLRCVVETNNSLFPGRIRKDSHNSWANRFSWKGTFNP